jgi:hypothetical protein
MACVIAPDVLPLLCVLPPAVQCKNMVQPHRALATFVYLASIAGTLAVAFTVSHHSSQHSSRAAA